jgi:hypothetical protein
MASTLEVEELEGEGERFLPRNFRSTLLCDSANRARFPLVRSFGERDLGRFWIVWSLFLMVPGPTSRVAASGVLAEFGRRCPRAGSVRFAWLEATRLPAVDGPLAFGSGLSEARATGPLLEEEIEMGGERLLISII